MATVDKNFKVKHGLVVEGTTGTINGEDIITTGSTTDDLGEGTTNVYYTEGRAKTDAAELLTGATLTNITITGDGDGLTITAENGVADSDTDDLAEGTTNKYYSDTLVDNHLTGGDGIDYSSGTISARLKAEGGLNTANTSDSLQIDRTTVDAWYDPAGAASTVAGDLSTHISDTSTHGVTGDIVGTTDAQVLTNKTVNDELYFTNPSTTPNDGGIKINDSTEDFEIKAYVANLHLQGQEDVTVTAVNGDIVLSADGATYINSVSAGNQVATNAYVDNAVSGLAWKEAVNLFATANIPLTGNTETVVVDGHAALDGTDDGYRLLLTNQSTKTENGIYVYADNGTTYTLTRSDDADTVAELIGAAVFVMEGTQYGSTSWVQGNHYANSFDDLSWTQFSGGGTVVAGTGISVDGLEISIDRTTVDTWYEADGAVSTHSGLTTGVHGVTGNVVGTSDTQTLTNKTVSDSLHFQDGGNNYSAIYASVDDLKIDGSDDIILTTNNGDIILNADGTSYLGSASSANEIATRGYVDDQTTATIAEDPSATTTSGTMYFTDARAVDALEAVVPNFTAVEVNSLAKQIAATSSSLGSVPVAAYSFAKADYRTAKFIVKIDNGTENEVTEVLLTLDSADNIAITEYAIIGTNGNRGTITADISGSNVRLIVDPVNDSTINVVGTLLA